MADTTLHKFYLSLLPNVIRELYFYIPDTDFVKEVLKEVDNIAHVPVNIVYVLDDFDGPVVYTSERKPIMAFSRSGRLERNLFALVEKKAKVSPEAFKYTIDKYLKLLKAVLYVLQWMEQHMAEYIKDSEATIDMFRLQTQNTETHVKQLITDFYNDPNDAPNTTLKNSADINVYYQDLQDCVSGLSQSDTSTQQITVKDKPSTQHVNKTSQKIKEPLITKEKAKAQLLSYYFNIT
ncbi:hypothetical protein KFZ70_14990 [Tamlana fucoidanivorans]|uniref:Uncharacterized protein n=1 Tax=Allotamlana fucoidanivorans TaxID=2583814 RepID=A0A5C4SFU5_9FLAO|nr:hypothetical protein [Tamlana fucoidanivorans]TNJ42475.1 hypothetical protein FGF67_14515 [Tamlana fucoidanivorans]